VDSLVEWPTVATSTVKTTVHRRQRASARTCHKPQSRPPPWESKTRGPWRIHSWNCSRRLHPGSSTTQRGQNPRLSHAVARSPVRETKGPRLATNSPKEWLWPALLGNHAVNHTKGPALASAFGHRPNLHRGNLGLADYGGRTLGTAHRGCIPEPTYVGGLGPSLITGHSQDFHPGSLRSMAHGELARGMARDGRDTLGNCEISQTNRSTPVIGYCPVQTRPSRNVLYSIQTLYLSEHTAPAYI
jgi:hypothetical protein